MTVTTGALLGITAVALGLVLTPGPNMIYLVSRTLTQGRRAGLVSLTGVAAGFLIYLTAATAGLVAIFTVVPALYTAIKLAGAAYLLHLAYHTLKPGGANVFDPQPLPPDSTHRLFTMGLVTNLLNPKIAILYVSLLPQFVDPSRGHVALQSLTLGSAQILVALTVNALIVLSAGAIAGFLATPPSWLKIQRYVMGGALAGLAITLATDRSEAAVATG